MKTREITRFTFLTFAFIILIVIAPLTGAPTPASADVEDWQRGASIRSNAPDSFASVSFKQALSDLAETNANFVTLIMPWKQQDLHANEIYSVYATPSEEALAEAIQYAHSLGLQVNLKPHLDEENYAWRARIAPSDPNAWFRSYSQMLLNYGRIAEEHDVEMITIGSELASITTSANTDRWRDLIEQVREVYSGSLTYSANWGGSDWSYEKDSIEFWDDLDYIGLAAYFYFDPPYHLGSLLSQWERWDREEVQPLFREYGKPILFTEVGYRSLQGALSSPWDWDATGAMDEEAQALGYQALFEYWDTRDYFEGVHIWDWKTGSDPAFWSSPAWATGYTPQDKEAQEVMERWFSIAPPIKPISAPPTTTQDLPPTQHAAYWGPDSTTAFSSKWIPNYRGWWPVGWR